MAFVIRWCQVQQHGSARIPGSVSGDYARMLIVRTSKSIMVAAVALWVSLVAFGNITDYGTNLAFVIHVLSMDTLFSGTTIRYRAITSQALHHAAYNLIIAAEAIAATFCWIAAFRMFRSIPDPAAFTRAKTLAVVGLTTCLLIWLVGFIAIGGEWFGMWMSERWNGIQSAFRFSALVLGTLIFVIAPDSDPTE
jgi:predicted small integral membrane protein